MRSPDPPWLATARSHIGQAEVPGPRSSKWIRDLWQRLKGGTWYWKSFGSDDSLLPWCGAYVAGVMREAGIAYPDRYASARAWLDWGIPIFDPALGCVVVYERGGGGHVGLVVGTDAAGRLMTLGGNQGNRVSIAPFDRARVLGYRWPTSRMADFYASLGPLPMLAANGQPSSSNEA